MCVAAVAGQQAVGRAKPISNVVNNTPVGFMYKQASGGEKLSDSVRSGKIALGLGMSAMMN